MSVDRIDFESIFLLLIIFLKARSESKNKCFWCVKNARRIQSRTSLPFSFKREDVQRGPDRLVH